MLRTKVNLELSQFPSGFHALLAGSPVYDSSCSQAAKVWFIDKDAGFYLKTASRGTLAAEASMTRFFHGKGLAAQMLHYTQQEADWLLTTRVPGEDCCFSKYLDDPKALSALLGTLLRSLHTQSIHGCPVVDKTKDYLDSVSRNHAAGHFDSAFCGLSQEAAWKLVQEIGPLLQSDTLLHGDYCLPNIMLQDWSFSGFIDLGSAGVGDAHIDLFWGLWSLHYNLKTDAWADRFLDAYGRDGFHKEILDAIGAFEAFL